MEKAPCGEKVGLKKGKWTAEEDEILMNYIKLHGEGSWRSLPMNAGLLRCGKSCRLRWLNYVKPEIRRGNISAEEDHLIVNLQRSLGNRWSLIARHLPGRTDNEIKNYWISDLSRRIDSFTSPSSEVQNTNSKSNGGSKPKGSGTSDTAMKKNNINSHAGDPKYNNNHNNIPQQENTTTLMNSIAVQNVDRQSMSPLQDYPYLERDSVVLSSSIDEENEEPLLEPFEGLETERMWSPKYDIMRNGVVVDSNGLLRFIDYNK